MDANLPSASLQIRTMLDEEIREALKRRHRKLRENDVVLSRFWRTYSTLTPPITRKLTLEETNANRYTSF